MIQRWHIDSYGVESEYAKGKWIEYEDHEQALAEKDREISQLTQSTEMLRYALQGSQDQYQQLMEKAILFAQLIATDYEGVMAKEAQAFLKERA